MRYRELMEEPLNELMGVKKFAGMTAREIVELMHTNFNITRDTTLRVLGQGASGVAMQIGADVYKFWLKDSAYEAFIKFVQANPGNPFLPRLKSEIKTIPAFFLRHAVAPNSVKYIKLEYLKADPTVMGYSFTYMTDDNKSVQVSIDDITLCMYKHAKSLEEFVSILSKRLSTEFIIDRLPNDMKLFIDTMISIGEIKNANDLLLDLHTGNFLVRGKRPVIIDPLLNSDDVGLNNAFYRFDNALFSNQKNVPIGKYGSRSSKETPWNDGDLE